MQAKVSVVLATYNGAEYLKEQLDSVLSQTLTPYEIVISDDNSSDNTRQIVSEYQKNNDNIKWFDNKNHGVNGNFENGLKQSTGDYIAFCDQDDIWALDKLEVLVNGIGDKSLAYCRSELIDSDGHRLDKSIEEHFSITHFSSDLSPLYFLNFNCISGHAMLFTRELAEKSTPFSEHVMYDQWIALVAAELNGIGFIDHLGVHHRIHLNNTHNNFELLREKKKNNKKSKFDRYMASNKKLAGLIDDLKATGVVCDIEHSQVLEEYQSILRKSTEVFFNYPQFRFMKLRMDEFFGNQSGVKKRLWKALRGGSYCRLADTILRHKSV